MPQLLKVYGHVDLNFSRINLFGLSVPKIKKNLCTWKCEISVIAWFFNSYTACDWFNMVKTQGMGLFLPDGSRLYDDEEVTDNDIVGEKLLFMDVNPPALNYVQGK